MKNTLLACLQWKNLNGKRNKDSFLIVNQKARAAGFFESILTNLTLRNLNLA
jgi:hypothetical protein